MKEFLKQLRDAQFSAKKAKELGIPYFATTLASSRWKNLEQINAAGNAAAKGVQSTDSCTDRIQTDFPKFWAQNWRKDGLQERRNALLNYSSYWVDGSSGVRAFFWCALPHATNSKTNRRAVRPWFTTGGKGIGNGPRTYAIPVRCIKDQEL